MKMPGNMQAMMQQAQKMQQKMQEEIAAIRVEGSAGGGMVNIKMDGQKNVLAVKIDPEVGGDVEMLQDLVLAACNEAVKKVDEETQRKTSSLLGGLSLSAWSGSLASGQSVTVSISTTLVSLDSQITVSPGGRQVTVLIGAL